MLVKILCGIGGIVVGAILAAVFIRYAIKQAFGSGMGW